MRATATMRVARLEQIRQPLVVASQPVPEPGPDDAVVRVEACGICRSDWHVWHGDWTWLGGPPQTLPTVLGHEIGGVIEEVGKNVRKLGKGDRVTIPFHCCSRTAERDGRIKLPKRSLDTKKRMHIGGGTTHQSATRWCGLAEADQDGIGRLR